MSFEGTAAVWSFRVLSFVCISLPRPLSLDLLEISRKVEGVADNEENRIITRKGMLS